MVMLDIPIQDLISVFFVIIAVTITLIISVKSYKSYRETKATLTFLIATAALFVTLAMLFLTLEKAFFTDTLPIFSLDLGMLFGAISIVISGISVLMFDLFAYEMAFPKKTAILGVLSAIPIIIYLAFWLWDPTRVHSPSPPYEIDFGNLFGLGFEFTPMLAYVILIPMFSIPIIILFYYAGKVRKESPLKSRRALGLGLGGSFLATAYIIEIIGIDPIITTVFRSFFIISGIFFYWALFKLKSKE